MRLVHSAWCFGLVLAAIACDDGNTNGTPSVTTPGIGGAQTTVPPGKGGQTTVGNGGALGNGGAAAGGTTTATATGGKAATGGAATGGKAATGGATFVDNPAVCDDVSINKMTLDGQYARAYISTTNNPSKNYVAITNWWGKFAGQTMSINGLGFTVTNSVTTDNPANPVGYPSIFIGTYQDNASEASNLPKLVSSITQAPTVFETNATSLDTSNFNAAYDVWFTANSTPLATVNGVRPSSPGLGGAYLMVWLYKPANKQPRGGTNATATVENKSWDVWVDNTNPPCITYVAKSPLSGLSFDLNNFIKDAVSRNVLKNSMYLSIIFGGFEIWSGGNGASVSKFCAKVN